MKPEKIKSVILGVVVFILGYITMAVFSTESSAGNAQLSFLSAIAVSILYLAAIIAVFGYNILKK